MPDPESSASGENKKPASRKSRKQTKSTTGAKRARKKSPAASSQPGTGSDCILVGIGASAGGLDAYKQFLRAVPDTTGCAFVLISHLDPTHESLMAGLLGKHTRMPVVQIEEPCPIEPDHVYVIPPNKFIKVADGALHLDEPVQTRSMRMPIDYFFRSLAEARAQRAICIVLTGTGSDGTQGVKEIKAAGGLTIAQQPDSAEYSGMPSSAAATGMIDFVARIEEMPEILERYSRHPYAAGGDGHSTLHQSSPSSFKSVLDLLRAHTDYDFGCYKKGTLSRRIQRRMGLRHVETITDYLKLLRTEPDEVRHLFKDLLIGVTRFFRDFEYWETLRNEAIRPLITAKDRQEPIRIWVPGCSSGEEAYSLAILVHEELDLQRRSNPLQLFATDLDEEAIRRARAGNYFSNISADVPEALLKRYFVSDGDFYRPNKRLRESCVFAVQNLISDPPFSNIDLISCRNLLIYLDAEVQGKLSRLLHFALQPEGVLFLGPSESVAQGSKYFTSVSKKCRIFRKSPGPSDGTNTFPVIERHQPTVKSLEGLSNRSLEPPLGTVELAHRALLDQFAPASVLIDEHHAIHYFHGELRRYLSIPSGMPTTDLFAMAAGPLAGKLRGLILQAEKERRSITGIASKVPVDGGPIDVRVSVHPIHIRPEQRLLLVCFVDEPPAKTEDTPAARIEPATETEAATGGIADRELVAQLRYELQATREDLQSTIEELETSNEELKASNEEVMSMNEELQSTNEELETSREELQSLNEELSTVNTQLEEKVEELEDTTNDLSNLLTSTKIATLFLDTGFRIRRRTPACDKLLNIIPGDIGRPISDLSPRVNDPDLLDDCKAVLEGLQPIEKEVTNGGGHVYMRRILPFRTAENKIEGVVVTFVDITRLKHVERQIIDRERRFTLAQENTRFGIWECGLRDQGIEFDPITRELFGIAPDTPIDRRLIESRIHPEDLVLVRERVLDPMSHGESVQAEHRIVLPSGDTRWIAATGSAVSGENGNAPDRFVGVVVDVTESKNAVERLRSSEARLQAIFNQQFQFVAILDPEGRLSAINDLPIRITGVERESVIGDYFWETPWFRDLPDMRKNWPRRLKEAARTQGPVLSEDRYSTGDGKVRVADASITAVKDDDGELSFFIIQATDTTEKKEAEGLLKTSETRFRATFDNAAVGIAHIAPDGRWVEVNDTLCTIVGYTRQELFERTFADITHPDDIEKDWELARQVLEGDIPRYSLEKRYQHKDGFVVWIHLTVSLNRDAEGNPDYFISIVEDISERKRAEHDLAVSRNRLQVAKDAARLGIYDYFPQTEQLIWDTRMRELWGLPKDREITLEMGMSGVHPDDRPSVEEKMQQAFEESSGERDFAAEYRVINATTKECIWVSAVGRAFVEDDKAVRMVGTVRDITDRREAEFRLQELTERLEEKVAERTSLAERRAQNLRKLAREITNAEESARRQIASNIHDDLQQILVAAKMRIPAEGQIASDKELKSIGELLNEAIRQARTLVTQLSPPVLSEGTIKEALAWLARQMEQNYSLDVTISYGSDCPPLPVELKTALYSIARELLFNAVKHSGSKQASLRLSCDDTELFLSVIDDGRGFDVAELDQDNEKFGLFSIKERIHAFGGSLEVESHRGAGTKCHVTIPIGSNADAVAGADHSASERNIEILIVEEREIFRQGLMKTLIDYSGFTFTTSSEDPLTAAGSLADSPKGRVIVLSCRDDAASCVETVERLFEMHPDLKLLLIAFDASNPDLAILRRRPQIQIVSRDIAPDALVACLRKLCLV